MKLLGWSIPFTNQVSEETVEEFGLHEIAPPKMGVEQAWAEDAIFQVTNQRKYNPDQLIGRKGTRIYTKMLMDEQVKAVVLFKRDAITSREFVFEVDREALGEEEADRRININMNIMRALHGTPIDAFNGILTSITQGVSYTEKNFTEVLVDGLTYLGIATLKLKPYDTFEFVVDDFGNIQRFIQRINGREQELDISKFIHHVQNPDHDLQYGKSELREAYRSWFSKDMIINFYNMWLERSAGGYKWIKTDSVPGSPEYAAIQRVLSKSINGAGMIIGQDDDFNLEFPANNVAFKEAIEMHDLSIARALLVPNLMGITPAGQTGSFSQSDTQLEAFLWTLDQEAARLEETLNEQLFRQLGEFNFGDDFWPRIKFQPISEKRKMNLLTLWTELVNVQAVTRTETDEKHIRTLLDFPEKGEDVIPDLEEEEEEKEGDLNPLGELDTKIHENGKKKPKRSKEGLMGNHKALYKHKFTNATKRIDFSVIQRASEAMEVDKSEGITDLFYIMIQDVVNQTRILDSQGTLETEQNKIRFDSKDRTKLKNLINVALKDFWKLGQRHAENEIDKAQGLAFSMKVDRKRLEFVSEDFFKTKSFRVAGKLSDDAIAIIQNVITNGVKGGKTFPEMEIEIYQAMGAKGYMDIEDYREALGSAVDPDLKNPQARIDTMLRTNGFEAINESRFNYFTDPQLDGFVEALEYSAILDNRTTQICQHLDGKVHEVDSSNWDSYRPPNHFNCRSLLIAVTATDSWTESSDPTLQPQEGFQ